MARIRFDNTVITAKPLYQNERGNWIMEAQQHGARHIAGGEVEIRPDEIIEMSNTEMPAREPGTIKITEYKPSPEAIASAAALEAAMAKERKSLPPVADMLKAIQEAAKPMRQAEASIAAGESGQRAGPFPPVPWRR
jgi:hypothetical protein